MTLFDEVNEDSKRLANIGFVFEVVLILFLGYLIAKHYRRQMSYLKSHTFTKHEANWHQKAVLHSTLPILVMYLCWNVNMLVSYVSVLGWTRFHFKYDSLAIVVGALLYLATKTLIYLTYVGRIVEILANTPYQYSSRVHYVLYALVAAYVLGMCAVIAVFFREHREYSKRSAPLMIVLPLLLFDALFTVLVTYLLLRRIPLTKGTSDSRTADRNSFNYIFRLKYGILTMMTVIVTILSLTFWALTGSTIFIAFESVWNSIFIMQLSAAWWQWFLTFFTPCMVCVAQCPCVPEDADNIQAAAQSALILSQER